MTNTEIGRVDTLVENILFPIRTLFVKLRNPH
jgi:hypothetical protein